MARYLPDWLRSRFTFKHMLKAYIWITAIIAIGQVAAYIIHFKAYSPSRFKELFLFALDFLFAAPYGVAVYFSFLAVVIFALFYSMYMRRLKKVGVEGSPQQQRQPVKYLRFILFDVVLYALSFMGTLLILRVAFVILKALFN